MPPTTPPPQSVSYTFLEGGFFGQIPDSIIPTATYGVGQVISFAASINFLWTLGLVACVGAASFVWVRGAAYGLEASEAGIRKRNEEWKRGSLGLLGVMILFLLIYTVNRGLLLNDINLQELASSRPAGTATPVTQTIPTSAQPSQTPLATNEAAIRASLQSMQISVNRAPCATGQTSQCTNVAGLSNRVMSMLGALRSACPSCDIVVTGGTEPGHSPRGNHPRGEAVDLRRTPSLTQFLQTNATLSGRRYLWGNFRFYDEPAGDNVNTTASHFHVD